MSRFEERLLFTLILALAGMVGVIALAASHLPPTAHPEVAGMTRGAPGAEHHDDLTLLLGWLFGVLTLALFAALMAFGARRRSLRKFLLAGFLLHLAVWTALVLFYRAELHEPTTKLFLSFPPATAVMLYLMLPVPLLFVLYFVFGFRRWVLTEDEQAAFQRLLESKDGRKS